MVEIGKQKRNMKQTVNENNSISHVRGPPFGSAAPTECSQRYSSNDSASWDQRLEEILITESILARQKDGSEEAVRGK